jgi:hypothetical protein
MHKKVAQNLIFAVSLLCGLATGCMQAPAIHQSDLVNLNQEIQTHGVIQQPDVTLYLRTRLTALGAPQIKVIVLNDTRPRAFSSTREILLSRGLLTRLRDASCLDFILAHEAAHILLRHSSSTQSRFELESQADISAAELLTKKQLLSPTILTLFDPYSAYLETISEPAPGLYPSPAQRRDALLPFITNTSTTLSSVHEKEFQLMRKILLNF